MTQVPAKYTAYSDEYLKSYDEGLLAEQKRCQAIIEHPNAEGRRQLALHFACNTSMTVEEAVGALAVSPVIEKPRASAVDADPLGFARAMGIWPTQAR